ncbi:MAG: hypothetical protein LBJ65_13595 [Burkholderia sp.]|jgi:predicted dienelactone hydrolase|nr:hypothetical protein [Burkholderia sp.]MDR0242630.1 hypothetical protein [Burkholderia sp.]
MSRAADLQEFVEPPADICTDAKGFDRVAFHKTLDAKALAFFNANLH